MRELSQTKGLWGTPPEVDLYLHTCIHIHLYTYEDVYMYTCVRHTPRVNVQKPLCCISIFNRLWWMCWHFLSFPLHGPFSYYSVLWSIIILWGDRVGKYSIQVILTRLDRSMYPQLVHKIPSGNRNGVHKEKVTLAGSKPPLPAALPLPAVPCHSSSSPSQKRQVRLKLRRWLSG